MLAKLQGHVSDPTVLLQPSHDLSASARQSAQALYKHLVRQMLAGMSKGETRALQQGSAPLLTNLYAGEGFDAEQVWVQLELATSTALRHIRKLVSKSFGPDGEGPSSIVKPELQHQIDDIILQDEEVDDGVEGSEQGEDEEDIEREGEDDEDDRSEDPPEKRKSKIRRGKPDNPPEIDADDEDKAYPAGWPRKAKNPVEDRFMRLAELEKFLLDAEAKDASRGEEQDDDDDDEDEEEDEDEEDDSLEFVDAEASDEDDEDADLKAMMDKLTGGKGKARNRAAGGAAADEGGKASTRSMMYKDFFGKASGEPEQDGEGEGEEGESGEQDFDLDDGMEEGEEDEDEDGEDRRASHRERSSHARSVPPTKGMKPARAPLADLSTHERRMARLQERITELESQAMGEKDWHLSGEADASKRPLNSALEVDMDFDTTVKAAPQITAEATADVEAMIKKRITERRFDDVVRVVPPPLEKDVRVVELDDSKSKKGLGDLYADDFVKATVGGVATDKDDKIRQEAKAVFQALVAKLDALSHFHFAPKPVVEELSVRTDVAAVLMEEAAPVAVSAASMRLPGEVFRAESDGAPKADGEMSREDRKRARAQRKRSNKAERSRKELEQRDRAVASGGTAALAGRKSAEDAAVLAKAGKRARPLQGADAGGGGRSEFGRSTAVFARLQDQQDQAKAGVRPAKQAGIDKDKTAVSSASLRL